MNQDYIFILEQATRAPSAHNTQPWLFSLSDDAIEIRPNYEKSLAVVDPYYRELFISLGCLIENICITASAKQYQTKIEIRHDNHIIVHLQKQNLLETDALFKQVNQQQTNRSQYNSQLITNEQLTHLASIPLAAGIHCYWYRNKTNEFNTLSDLILEGNQIQLADKQFKNELISWIRFNKKHLQNTNDGLSYAVFGAPNLPLFIVKPIISYYLNANKQNKHDSKKIASSSDFMLLTTQHNTTIEWINLGRTLQRLLLNCTAMKISYAYMNQPTEIETLSTKIQKTLGINEFPTLLLRLGFGQPQPYSSRKPIQELLSIAISRQDG